MTSVNSFISTNNKKIQFQPYEKKIIEHENEYYDNNPVLENIDKLQNQNQDKVEAEVNNDNKNNETGFQKYLKKIENDNSMDEGIEGNSYNDFNNFNNIS